MACGYRCVASSLVSGAVGGDGVRKGMPTIVNWGKEGSGEWKGKAYFPLLLLP